MSKEPELSLDHFPNIVARPEPKPPLGPKRPELGWPMEFNWKPDTVFGIDMGKPGGDRTVFTAVGRRGFIFICALPARRGMVATTVDTLKAVRRILTANPASLSLRGKFLGLWILFRHLCLR